MKLMNFVLGVQVSALVATLDAQNLVYEMPARGTYFQITEGTEYADSATLGGTDRFVTEASLFVFSNLGRTGDVTFSIYAAIPVSSIQPGQPGVIPGDLAAFQPDVNPLASVTLEDFVFAGGVSTEVVFSGIDTLVGDDIFWAVEFEEVSNLSGSGLFGPFLGNAGSLTVPGSETDPSRLYSRSEGVFDNAWVVTSVSGQPPVTSSLAVSITAIPEPGTGFLVLAGAIGLLRRRRSA
ncbi:PEP-CTERM sorting domain-containing protein [Haloferula sp. A504]|uniref:PEP-CTERM sorting domain-containing protein n=1 Tax=Haloferula sp. A504 TaxID=3373601 RepID=UPI0031C03D46|nr:PEP-CTERM sorting domain-containing protein [Verrucomicrobiaceae bacterium E54]